MNRLFIILLMAMAVTAIHADESQLEERLNPEIENVPISYNSYPGIHLDKNKIGMNGDDWTALGEKYRAALCGDSLFSVVYLGDSHVQADFGGSVLRSRLSANHPAGRGLVIPFRLAGTNQPNDYSFDMTSAFLTSKLMRLPWSTEMPFTGIGLQPVDHEFVLNLKSPVPVDILRIHTAAGKAKALSVKADGEDIAFEALTDNDSIMRLRLPSPRSEFGIRFDGGGDAVIGGIELLSDTTGVLVHSIGNNGATFSDYSLPPHFSSELARLHPDLIVIALGTNEAFGRIGIETLRTSIDNLVSTIRLHNPDTKILIAGPAECYRTIRRGRRSRRQVVNTKVAMIARNIRLYAEENNIPYYNHFAVAGNALSQRRAKLFSRDGVHYTAGGYRLWGNLLSDAILDAMKQ